MNVRVSKYPPTAIFRNANINAQRTRNRLKDLAYKSAAAYVEHTFTHYKIIILVEIQSARYIVGMRNIYGGAVTNIRMRK